MLLQKIKSLLLYGGLKREQYKKISPRIDESNRKSVAVYSTVTSSSPSKQTSWRKLWQSF